MHGHLEKSINNQYKKHDLQRPFIVAIDGLGGAGKTTLVQQLKNIGKHVVIIHMDEHIVEKKRRYHTGHEEWFEYFQLQWDVPYLKEQLFEKLHQNESQLRLPFYNKKVDSLEEKRIDIPPKSIVLTEGVFLLRDEWKAFYDFIIFLDCPKKVRCKRVL